MSANQLDPLLAAAGLTENAQKVGERLYRLQYGSAVVMLGTAGTALVAIAPLFRHAPPGQERAFFQRLLEHNAYMGGIACFAIQHDGWIVLHAGRPLRGLDADELATFVSSVGRFADELDDKLIAEFYAPGQAAP